MICRGAPFGRIRAFQPICRTVAGVLGWRYLSSSSALDRVLTSTEFQKAVQDCFPGDGQSQMLYTAAVAQSDSMGKLSAAITTIAIMRGFSSILGVMGAAGTWVNRALGALTTLQIGTNLWMIQSRLAERNPDIQLS